MTVWFLEQRKPSQMNEMVRPVPDAGRLLTIELLIGDGQIVPINVGDHDAVY